MSNPFVYGAGLAGLLAGHMLRSLNPKIVESQDSLPNNHGALLRFRTDKVARACATPFKKVKVQKAIKYDGKLTTTPNLFLSNLYSQKVTGSVLNRSINNLDPVERYIAPWDLISQMAEPLNIGYSFELDSDKIHSHVINNTPIISTIPMPALMHIVDWQDRPEFPSQQIWTRTGRIQSPECDIYQTIYYPDPLVPFYRISIVGDIVISEYIKEPDGSIGPHLMEVLMDDFGIKPYSIVDMKQSSQKYGKIQPINEDLRKQFIYEMTTKYNIYSVGRFATWRQLLMDDVVDDIQHVERFIRSKSDYGRMMHSQKGENT
jgi:hypothetical protein